MYIYVIRGQEVKLASTSAECSRSSLAIPKEVVSILAGIMVICIVNLSGPLLDTEMAIVSSSFGRQSQQYL